MMRPKSIKAYEICYLGAVLFGVVAIAVSWNTNLHTAEMQDIQRTLGPSFVPVFFVFVYTLSLALWYFTARVPNLVAKWIVTLWFALSLATFLMTLAQGQRPTDVSSAVSIAALVLNAAAVYLLFRPDARAWFGEA